MKKSRKVLILLLCSVLGIGAVAGIAAAVRMTTGSTVLVVQAANFNYGGGWFSSGDTVSGVMTTNAEQTIYLTDAEEVAEVFVQQGQAVHAGDVLFTYDTKRTGMNLEKAKIAHERIQMDIEVCEQNLKTLHSIDPVSDGGFSVPGDFAFFEPEEETVDYGSMPSYTVLDENSTPRNAPGTAAGAGVSGAGTGTGNAGILPGALGTEDTPYIFLAGGDEVTLTEAFIAKWQKTAAESQLQQLFIAVEKRAADGTLLKAWTADIMKLDPKTAITLDMTTGETSYAKMDDPEKLAALLEGKEPAVIAEILKKLNPDDLTAAAGMLDAETLGAVLAQLDGEQLTAVLGTLSPERQREIMTFLQEEEERRKQEEGQQGGEGQGGSGSGESGQGGSGSGESGQGGSGSGESGQGGSGSGESGQGGSESGEGGQGGSGSGESGQGGSESGEGGQGGSTVPEEGGSQGNEGDNNTVPPESGVEEGTPQGRGGHYNLLLAAERRSAVISSMRRSRVEGRENLPPGSALGAGGSVLSTGGGVGLIDPDSMYTSEELEKAIREQENKLKTLQLDLRESDLKIARAQKAVDEGSARATMNGVIKLIGDPENPPKDGTPFLRLTSAEGLFVRSALRENMLGTIQEGDLVTVRSWQNGMSYEAEVRDISPYPDESGMFSRGDTESYYPFTAYISDAKAELQNDEWVEVSFAKPMDSKSEGAASLPGGNGNIKGEQTAKDTEVTEIPEETLDPEAFESMLEEEGPSSFYLWKAFVREENGRYYVFMEDEHGRLRKQYIEIGSLSGESYEVLSGLTGSDWIAFPYGKNVKEGARTREGTVDELYNG